MATPITKSKQKPKAQNEPVVNIAPRPTLIKSDGDRAPRPLPDIIKDGLVSVMPELAVRIIREAIFERQRPVRPLHVAALAAQMRNREWTAGTQIHFGRMPDGSLHLVNGQHRLHAVIKADAIIQFQVLITDVADDAGLTRLYRRHDRLTAPRAATDTLTAEAIHARYDLRHEIASAVYGAVLIIDGKFSDYRSAKSDPYLRRSDEARLRATEPWWPIGHMYQDCIRNAPHPYKSRLQGFGVTAVGLLTLRDQEAKADPFWRGIADNDGLARNDPRAAYLRYLAANRTRTPFEAAKAVAMAWNAFYADEERELIRVFSTPIDIAGCDI